MNICTVQNYPETIKAINISVSGGKTAKFFIRNCPYYPKPLIEDASLQLEDIKQLVKEYLNLENNNPAVKRNNQPSVVRKTLIYYLKKFGSNSDPYRHPTNSKLVVEHSVVEDLLFNLLVSCCPKSKRNNLLADWLVKNAEVKNKTPYTYKEVHRTFLKYLRTEYTSKESYHHPDSTVYSYTQITQAMNTYVDLYKNQNGVGACSLQYRALWALYTTRQSKTFILHHFDFQGDSLNRLWRDATDGVMLILRYPHLMPNKYTNENYAKLWALILTPASRTVIADYFTFSESTIRRSWNDMLDIVMTTFLYPTLGAELACELYRSRG